VAELSTTSPAPWFAAFLSQEQLLADAGTRDAVMHAIQACVPDATLLPQGIEKLYLSTQDDQDTGFVVMDARERFQDGDSYCYDVEVRSPSGTLVGTLGGPVPAGRAQEQRLRSVGAVADRAACGTRASSR